MARFDPIEGGRRLKNYLKVMTLEAQTIARACGKNHLHNLEPEDLVALTMEAAAMARSPACRNRLVSRQAGHILLRTNGARPVLARAPIH